MRSFLAAFCAILSAGLRPRTPLARGIAATLCVKLCVVVAMRLFLFGGENRVAVDPSVMDDRLMSAATQYQGN